MGLLSFALSRFRDDFFSLWFCFISMRKQQGSFAQLPLGTSLIHAGAFLMPERHSAEF
jgi:hypothetical protein